MKDKRRAFAKAKRGDAHPFAGYLYEDEHVLWISTTKSSTESHISEYLFAVYVLLMIILVILLIIAEQMANNDPNFKLKEFGVLLRVINAGYWIIGAAYYSWSIFRPFKYAYAVTNQRVLYRHFDQVQSLFLTHIPQIQLSSLKRSYGTISFGRGFPQWKRIKKAVQVTKIIKQAQKNIQNGAEKSKP
jgi:hypothetical protein